MVVVSGQEKWIMSARQPDGLWLVFNLLLFSTGFYPGFTMSEQQTVSAEVARSVDTEYLVRKSMTSGYHIFSLLAPPAYLAFTLSRYGRNSFSLNRLLRATWIGGGAGTTLFSSSFHWLKSRCRNYRWWRIWLRKIQLFQLRATCKATASGCI